MKNVTFKPATPSTTLFIRRVAETQDWQAAVGNLYQEPNLKDLAINLTRKAGIPEYQGEDILHDSILILIHNLQAGRFNGKCSLRTYLLAIVKWRSIGMARPRKTQFLPLLPEILCLPGESLETEILERERTALFDSALDGIGQRRGQILRLVQAGFSMEEVAGKMGFNSAGVARKEAHVSRHKLKAYINERSELREDLIRRRA